MSTTIALGIVLNEVLSWGLKRLIAQPRPTREQHHHHQEASALGKRAGGALLGTLQEMITADSEDARTAEAVAEAQVLSSTPQISTQFTEFGMPSSHAQFAFFVAVYLILFMYASRRHQAASFANPHWRHLISVLLLAGAALIAFARVYLWYHTSLQVVVGAFVGAAAAAAWHHITNRWLRPCFPHIQRWRIARYFYIRDSSHIPNILRFEYDAAVQESERRAREAASKGQ
ncbi:dolichyldiphosphatase 1 [Capsaspora owczarzaki ATCC 30864]|uniref:dolichyldiphosphatase 1 n=1 Tax=Capsaspora owczarzaki (strain ATCC 30864) TaxID=595528 RepID=UPI0001FE45FF|nr:dolichyldiphosphatase 1 [Capsaspora owczarzaki ATCC 30864]|eukprot:XP_004344390.1 dolichyldiphosphatase 1 [Capsaspora owczarzaki ATCC 30864]